MPTAVAGKRPIVSRSNYGASEKRREPINKADLRDTGRWIRYKNRFKQRFSAAGLAAPGQFRDEQMGIENEVKFEVSPNDLQKLTAARSLRPANGQFAKHKYFVSTYFDTPKHDLRRSGVSLRVRQAGKKRIPTIKTARNGIGLVAASGKARSKATSQTCAPPAARLWNPYFQRMSAAV